MSIICGDCLEVLKTYPDNHFSACVTDPPYGLSFMNRKWDYGIPSFAIWREVCRVLKPGGFLLSMGGTRTFHRLACAIEDAGFEIRDCLMWLYGSGFPKSHNHFGIEGYGTALKPAWEPCIMAMKPLEGTFKNNAEKWGQAGINIEACRVEGSKPDCINVSFNSWRSLEGREDIQNPEQRYNSNQGRWPANLILDEEAGEMLGEHSRFFYCAKASSSERNEGCSGLEDKAQTTYSEMKGCVGHSPNRQSSSKNNHPTVKPLKLMEYLIKLVMPPKDGILLEPFAGSGTTILAANRLGFDAVGIELSEEYCEIARARVYGGAE